MSQNEFTEHLKSIYGEKYASEGFDIIAENF